MLPVVQIGPLALPAPQLILLAGFWIGLELTERQAERFHAASGPIYNLTLVAVLAGLAGARLVYAAQYPSAFLAAPLNLLTPRPQMLDSTGGLIIGLLAALLYGWVKKLPLWPTLDAVTTLFSVMGVTLGLAHFASGDAFGAPSRVPWAIELWGEQRHPAQVYETLAAVLIAWAVWPGSRFTRYASGRSGLRFWVFLALSAAARLFLETFRGDSVIVLNMFRQAQLIAWPIMAISLWQIGSRVKALEEPHPPAPSPLSPQPCDIGEGESRP